MDTKNCDFCGAFIERPALRTDDQWEIQRYCNSRCSGDATRQRHRRSTPPRQCKVCGGDYWPGLLNRSLNHCGTAECKATYLAGTGERISRRHKADYANGARRRGPGLSPRETALWPLLAPHGWLWNLRWIDADGDWQLDFAHEGLRLNVEIDGIEHREPRNVPKDAARDAYLGSLGWRVLRLPNEDVDADAQAVVDRVLAWADSHARA